jgi:hypothetical protein
MTKNYQTSHVNNYPQSKQTTKVITTMDDQNLTKNDGLTNDLFYGDLGEELLFGNDEQKDETRVHHPNQDSLFNNQELPEAFAKNPNSDILTEGGDISLLNSSDEKLDLVQDLNTIIEQIYVNENGFGINLSDSELSTKFDFNSTTGTLSYQGREFLLINSDGSFEILANLELL